MGLWADMRGGPSIPSNYTAVYSVWPCLSAVAVVSTKHLRTGYLSPSSLGPTLLWEQTQNHNADGTGTRFMRSCTRAGCIDKLTFILVRVPESILLRMVRAHFRKPSSTFSPVRALVSRNISSMEARKKSKANGEKDSIRSHKSRKASEWKKRKMKVGQCRLNMSHRSPERSATPPGRSPLCLHPGPSCYHTE